MKWSLRKHKDESKVPPAPKEKRAKKSFFNFSRKPPEEPALPTGEVPVFVGEAAKVRKRWFFKSKPKKEKTKKEKKKSPLIESDTTVEADANTAGKKARKIKSVKLSVKKPSFPRKSRFTLLIGDEGVILLHMKGKKVLSREFVADASKANLAELKNTIEKDDIAPITMIIDSVDQVFVQQTLPPVSSMSVQKLINKRLEREFKPEDIKGALVLGREKTGRKDWNFLMVSVEKSPQIMLWLDFIMQFNNRFRGIILLSVETELLLKNLERAMGLATKPGTGPEWKILVSHNKVGGFRQIILRNGRLIFTRLAMPVGEPTADVIAGNIEQEMLNTIEYLKRFGYHPRSGLNVYVIASQDVCSRLDPRRFEAQNFHALSPFKVSEYLGIEGATQPSDQFGDVVLASAIGSIPKNVLKLTTIESRLFDKFQLLKIGQRLVVTFTALGMIVYGAYLGYASLVAASDIADFKQKQSIHRQGLDGIKKKIADTGMDIDKVIEQFELYQQIKDEARAPLPFLAILKHALEPTVVIKEVEWKWGDVSALPSAMSAFTTYPLVMDPNAARLPGNPPPPGMPPVIPPPPGMPPVILPPPGMPPVILPPPGMPPVSVDSSNMATVRLSLIFPTGLNSVPLFKKFADEVTKNLSAAMPNATIIYTKVPPEYLPKEGLQLTFEDQRSAQAKLGQTTVEVELMIRGDFPSNLQEGGLP